MNTSRRLTELQLAAREVLVQMFGILLCTGDNEEDVRKCAHSCIEAARNQIKLMPLLSQDIDAQEIGNVLRTWHRHAKFLSTDGYPRPLHFNGPNGLRSLISRYYPVAQVEQTFSAMKSAGLVRKTNNDRWLPTRKHAVFPHLTSELLGHLSEGVSRLVETVIGNVTAEHKEEVLFERSAKVREFPVSAAQDFREFIKAQAISFLGAVDDWMEGKAELERKKKGRKCTVGVFTFAFMDERPRKRGKDSRRKFVRSIGKTSG